MLTALPANNALTLTEFLIALGLATIGVFIEVAVILLLVKWLDRFFI